MSDESQRRRAQRVAESIRQACIDAAVEGYERAAMSGLCHEGAWESAISAIRMLDLEALVDECEPYDADRSKIETRSTGKTRK